MLFIKKKFEMLYFSRDEQDRQLDNSTNQRWSIGDNERFSRNEYDRQKNKSIESKWSVVDKGRFSLFFFVKNPNQRHFKNTSRLKLTNRHTNSNLYFFMIGISLNIY